MVTEDSAMFVATMIFVLPSGAGRKANICSSLGTRECNITKWPMLANAPSACRIFSSKLIIAHVGKKIKTDPPSPRPCISGTMCLSTSRTNSKGICCSFISESACTVLGEYTLASHVSIFSWDGSLSLRP